MEWYYILGIISYGIFIIQFLLSNFFGWGDLDLDIDFDGEPDFGLGDVLSFKGLVHFAMGFSGWLMLAGKVTLTTLAIASVIGFTRKGCPSNSGSAKLSVAFLKSKIVNENITRF